MTRDQIIEAVARAIARDAGHDPDDMVPGATKEAGRVWRQFIGIAETVIAAIPGLADVLDGKAVIVPAEPTSAMIRDGVSHRMSTCISGENPWAEDTRSLYAALIAARPHRKDPTP